MCSKQDHVSPSAAECNSGLFALMSALALKLFVTGGEGQGELKTDPQVLQSGCRDQTAETFTYIYLLFKIT